MEPVSKLNPKPVLRVHLDDITHPATLSFLSLIDCARILPNSIKNVLLHLYDDQSQIPQTRSVTLVLRGMDGVAYTTGRLIDNDHKEIHFNLNYIKDVSQEPTRVRDEICGVITHEMVHAYQFNCEGTAPGGLIEGIADYVRLKSGLAPPHWKKGDFGEKWDAGYQRTAYFLEWLETTYGAGTICKMNATMQSGKYQEKGFWAGLFGEEHDVHSLFQKYKASLNESSGSPEKIVDSEELVLIEKHEATETEDNEKARGYPVGQ